jgi:hypothetical protein
MAVEILAATLLWDNRRSRLRSRLSDCIRLIGGIGAAPQIAGNRLTLSRNDKQLKQLVMYASLRFEELSNISHTR